MSYAQFKQLCQEAWKGMYSHLKMNRLDNEETNCICKEGKKLIKYLNQHLILFEKINKTVCERNSLAFFCQAIIS